MSKFIQQIELGPSWKDPSELSLPPCQSCGETIEFAGLDVITCRHCQQQYHLEVTETSVYLSWPMELNEVPPEQIDLGPMTNKWWAHSWPPCAKCHGKIDWISLDEIGRLPGELTCLSCGELYEIDTDGIRLHLTCWDFVQEGITWLGDEWDETDLG